MGSWRRRRQSEIHDQEGSRVRSETRKPTQEVWQLTVPSWEKKFCSAVGSVPWRKLLETKKYMHMYGNVVNWNDSAGEEAFNNAKSRFWAKINGLPCELSLPDPDIYIDNIDWNSKDDIELYRELEKELNSSGDYTQDENVLILDDSLLLNQSFSFSCTGWGDAEENFEKEVDFPVNPGVDGKNPWEHDYDDRYEAMKDRDIYLDGQGVDRDRWPTWGVDNWNKDGSGWYDSRYKTSRFPGNDYQTDRGYRGRRKGVNATYDRQGFRQWNFKSCAPVNNHHGSGRGGNPWGWEKQVL